MRDDEDEHGETGQADADGRRDLFPAEQHDGEHRQADIIGPALQQAQLARLEPANELGSPGAEDDRQSDREGDGGAPGGGVVEKGKVALDEREQPAHDGFLLDRLMTTKPPTSSAINATKTRVSRFSMNALIGSPNQ